MANKRPFQDLHVRALTDSGWTSLRHEANRLSGFGHDTSAGYTEVPTR